MKDYQIILACPSDAVALANLHIQVWQETYFGILPEAYLQNLDVKDRHIMWQKIFDKKSLNKDEVYLLKFKGQIVGFSHFGNGRDDGISDEIGEIFAIYILKTHQKKGFGKVLLQKVFFNLANLGKKSAYLWVLEGNPTINFYTRLGGQVLGKKTIGIGDEQFKEIRIFWPQL